jgi:hypothetical protein
MAHHFWGSGMSQLLANRGRDEYAIVQAWQNFHCLD